jgi:hypothetical protein
MFIALSITLILFFAFGFWIIKESTVNLTAKVIVISLFFLFCSMFAVVWESAMGWSARDKYIPSIISIRHVVIKEPNEQLGFKGNIYFLLEMPPTKYDSIILNIFAYKTDYSEPRLYRLPYSRKLHEELQKNVIPSLQKGQIVRGKFSKIGKGQGKGKGEGEGEEGDGKDGRGKNGKGGKPGSKGGSESMEQEYMFYLLPPSYFLQKH